jgi:polyisoprenyl-phosphate glycosyltransferase
MIKEICIVIPVYNDWTSLWILLDRLNQVAKTSQAGIFVTVINDGSTELPQEPSTLLAGLTALMGVEVVQLALNMGHQRAIAIGLCVAVEDHNLDGILVMDGDGEDPPESIPMLLEAAGDRDDFCIVARRRKRTEKLTFRLSYVVYKSLFRIVTGKQINFGNFSLTSRGYARRLAMISDLWNNLAAAILRSRIPVQRLPVDRGHRYSGSSKMNFVSLIIHGFSSISVYAETILVRLLLLTVLLSVLTFLSIVVVFFLRIFFPAHATPGWATTVSFGMIIILTQVCLTTISSLLMLLNSRVQHLIRPVKEFRAYIESRRLLVGRRPNPATEQLRQV